MVTRKLQVRSSFVISRSFPNTNNQTYSLEDNCGNPGIWGIFKRNIYRNKTSTKQGYCPPSVHHVFNYRVNGGCWWTRRNCGERKATDLNRHTHHHNLSEGAGAWRERVCKHPLEECVQLIFSRVMTSQRRSWCHNRVEPYQCQTLGDTREGMINKADITGGWLISLSYLVSSLSSFLIPPVDFL